MADEKFHEVSNKVLKSPKKYSKKFQGFCWDIDACCCLEQTNNPFTFSHVWAQNTIHQVSKLTHSAIIYLSVNGNIEQYQKKQWNDAMDDQVGVDEISLKGFQFNYIWSKIRYPWKVPNLIVSI